MARPDLFQLLKSHVPQRKILLRRHVVDVIEDDRGVLCKCSDGAEYWSDMVVGADGAYSTVRERMYHQLKPQNQPPSSDDQPLKYTHHCVLGVSKELDPNILPAIKDRFSRFEVMLFRERRCSIWLAPIEGNKISWCYGGEIDQLAKDAFSPWIKSHWGKTPTGVRRMLDEIQDVPTAYGCKVGDIINTTPEEQVSSVALEEKFFETWHSKRIVLLGDGTGFDMYTDCDDTCMCSMVLPFAGQGAVHAMIDALYLTNLLHSLRGTSTSDFEELFRAYYLQRSESARKAVIGSRLFGHFMVSKGFLAQWIRRIALNLMPHWLTRTLTDMVMRNRPQLSFLPMIEDQGIVKAWY
ncbi:hypothetical protein BGZ65_006243 [Modicella reniformis]|uniref:FAD-binding domain-containing protein n=1 Tax=Modicella reniformis TaxID=1440133 RepID=A0A9P6SVI7_9FUNG|nr:hypothetical protein BGZ65_006243 [Modicella reniformis]